MVTLKQVLKKDVKEWENLKLLKKQKNKNPERHVLQKDVLRLRLSLNQ